MQRHDVTLQAKDDPLPLLKRETEYVYGKTKPGVGDTNTPGL
ncbi:MAG TPA: hypothetical protein VFG20_03070 [Planctomycetaceae bacterium]|nr:hypothetical protein [Planctomycetaceae bacterium]